MIKYDVKSNTLSIGADALAFFACPHGDIERRATSAARHTPEGARAAKEIAHSAKSGFERSPVICDSVTLDSLEYSITCTPDAIINDASGRNRVCFAWRPAAKRGGRHHHRIFPFSEKRKATNLSQDQQDQLFYGRRLLARARLQLCRA